MILQQRRLLISTLECIFFSLSCQSFLQMRQCAFQVSPQNNKYRAAGNVSGSVQLCENTQCCVGYFLIIDGQPKVDVLACDVAEKSCPDEICKGQTRFGGRLIKCVCNTDLCNSNLTMTPLLAEPEPTDSYYTDEISKNISIGLVGVMLVLCILIVAAKWRGLFKEKKDNPPSFEDYSFTQSCSCPETKTSDSSISDPELQQVVTCGHFASVWKGKHQGSVVAVKVFPAVWKEKWAAEKEVYELPLMKHAGIVHFLDAGRKPGGGSWMIVLQFAEYGSLHSFFIQTRHQLDAVTEAVPVFIARAFLSPLRPSQTRSGLTAWAVGVLNFGHSEALRANVITTPGLIEENRVSHFDLLEMKTKFFSSNFDLNKPPVAHRDLSSSNVLVRADGTCMLCDFGCSTILRSCLGQNHPNSHTTNIEGCAQMGTLRYMSPEILEGSVNLRNPWCLLQGDVYALGLLLWEIWMRCSDLFQGSIAPQHLLPYESELGVEIALESLILHVCYMDERPSIPKHWELLPQGSVLQELLADCWDCDPEARLTAQCAADRLDGLGPLQSYLSP